MPSFHPNQAKNLLHPILGVLVLTLLVGFTLGQVVMSKKLQKTQIQITEDNRAKVPVVSINGIYDGELSGKILGEARVFLDENQIVPNADGVFNIRADDLFINYVKIRIPEGMNYVASKKGKYYYSVTSVAGERIIPKNRVYFESKKSAQNAGFQGK